ncbi:tRNA (adenosine(37)-N6)-dimethylallyltransferase MiaA [Devriesea agamarum]|uniref:tRNA (adenosine(37)-N6)-dimethylallyltransferase MiaA n=1 Tax=Devriesea agamarum TaxID=472569 RepID=UPI00071C3047|nr:tRNA (adenosine(37)-N6)-dimethylallyltransferase MiaA [Devriesea agamarum]
MTVPPPLLVVVGATATGKSALAVQLAHRLNGEIINADALQLYRGMDIGTAKVTREEREGVPHHLLDVLDVTQEASVKAYQREARRICEEIRARGKVPIAVGGSGLYVRALTDHMDMPGTDPVVRARYEAIAEQQGPAALHHLLTQRDPEAASVIIPSNVRRVIRALEVGELTGKPFVAVAPPPQWHLDNTVAIGLRMPREHLHQRIDLRARRMFAEGLLDETQHLREQGLDRGKTASRAIGYSQALAVLDGTMTLDQAIEATTVGTRRLVRKQDTWFRRDQRVRWVDALPGDDLIERAMKAIDD